MIRKMLTIAAASVIPMTGFVGAVAMNATPAAAGVAIVSANCNIGGTLAFAGAGLQENGQTGYTGAYKKTTTIATMATASGSDAACSTSSVVSKIQQPSSTCAANGPLIPIVVLGISLTPNWTNLPGCFPAGQAKPAKTYYAINSAWGFAGGSATGPVTQGILTALAKGVKYTESNGAKMTLIPTAVAQQLPGGVCGLNAGFQISGHEKKATAVTFTLLLCLGTATVTGLDSTGAAPKGTFLGDLTSEILDFWASSPAAPVNDTLSITSANFDTTSSTLHIVVPA